MRKRPLPLPANPARWTLLERTDAKAVLARGRHHLAIFREGQEITVLLCAPDWTLTPHGIIEGTAGITLFPRAHPPEGCPDDLVAAAPWIAARAAGRPAQELTAAMEAVAAAWAAFLDAPAQIEITREDARHGRLRISAAGASPGPRLSARLDPPATQALALLANAPGVGDDSGWMLLSLRATPPESAHARLAAAGPTARRALARTGLAWPAGILP